MSHLCAPQQHKFVFINYSQKPVLGPYHGKAVGLGINDVHAVFPSLFIIHEMRVRGHNPFQPTNPTLPQTLEWQNWIVSDNLFNEDTNTFNRDHVIATNHNVNTPWQNLATNTNTGHSDGPSGGYMLLLDNSVVDEILAATRQSASWKACEMEGLVSWAGTADENIRKYISSVPVARSRLLVKFSQLMVTLITRFLGSLLLESVTHFCGPHAARQGSIERSQARALAAL
jgi:hypothetical protein